MFPRLLSLTLALFVVGIAPGQQVDNKKVRDLVQLPSISLVFGIYFNPERGFILHGDEVDVPAKIAALEKELRGDAGDADRYCRLSYLYQDTEKAKRAATAALNLARRQMQDDPRNGRFAMCLGEALLANKQDSDGEMMLRRAVALAPGDADCWLALGGFLEECSFRALVGKNEKLSSADVRMLFTGAWPQRPADENVAKRQRLAEEARQCYEKAVAAAPGQAKPYIHRASSCCLGGVIDAFVRLARGEEKDRAAVGKRMCAPELLHDLEKAADLSPGNARIQGAAGFFQIMSAMVLASTDQAPGTGQKLQERIRQLVERTSARLTPLTAHQDKHVAADACYIIGLLEFMNQDKVRAEKWVRQAVALHPRHDPSWDFLVMMLIISDKLPAVVPVCEERLRHKDTPRNRYLAARAHVDLGQLDQAQRHVEASLRNEPDNILTNLCLTALLLKRADQPPLLAQAVIQLHKTETLLFKMPNSEFMTDAIILEGVHATLTGDTDTARRILRDLTKNKKNELAERILTVLGG